MKFKIKLKDISFIVLIALYITSNVLPLEINNLDEIWNFNFARCIANGLIPYKDFNIIQGPLLPMICGGLLKIFGQEMIITRFITIIVDTIIIFMIFKIMGKLKIKEFVKYIIVIILAIIMKPYFAIDYNWASLLNILIILYLEIKNKENKKKSYNILIGLISGLLITIKQTTGIVITLAVIGYKIFEIRDKKEIKEYIKGAILRTIGAAIAPIFMIIILLKLGALNDYIDYCILGISTFSNKISYIDRLIKNSNILIRFLSIFNIFTYLILIYMYIKKSKKETLILLLFSIISLIFVYPISDEVHFVIAIPITLISMGYILDKLINKFGQYPKIEIIITCILEVTIITTSIFCFAKGMNRYKNLNKNTELNHFKYLPIEEQGILNIKEIDDFIESKEKQVIIQDATAALYMIPINRYNKNYDMFLKGNIGSKGEEGQIEILKNSTDKIILIRNDNYQRNWQNPEKVRTYIKNNMKKTGQIGIFDIYE